MPERSGVDSSLDRAIGVGRRVGLSIRAELWIFGTEDVRIGPATVNFPPPEGKKPDAVHTLQTTKESAHLYRYVNGL